MRTVLACVLLLAATGCRHNVVSDPSYTIRGSVLDATSGLPVDSACIGIARYHSADSTLFPGDSINVRLLDSLAIYWWSGNDGNFRYDWFLAVRDTGLYKDFFAYKPGYKPWRYSRQPVEIHWTNASTDEFTVQLSSR